MVRTHGQRAALDLIAQLCGAQRGVVGRLRRGEGQSPAADSRCGDDVGIVFSVDGGGHDSDEMSNLRHRG